MRNLPVSQPRLMGLYATMGIPTLYRSHCQSMAFDFLLLPVLRTLMARVHDTVMKRVRCKQAQLDLHNRDGKYGMGLADRVRADLAQADATDLALLNQFGQDVDRGVDGDVRVDPRTFENIDGLGSVQHLDGLLDRRADTFRAAIGARLHVVGTFDAEHDLVGVFWVLLEVVLDQM